MAEPANLGAVLGTEDLAHVAGGFTPIDRANYRIGKNNALLHGFDLKRAQRIGTEWIQSGRLVGGIEHPDPRSWVSPPGVLAPGVKPALK